MGQKEKKAEKNYNQRKVYSEYNTSEGEQMRSKQILKHNNEKVKSLTLHFDLPFRVVECVCVCVWTVCFFIQPDTPVSMVIYGT